MSKDCIMYTHCTKSLQIYDLHTNANQNLARVWSLTPKQNKEGRTKTSMRGPVTRAKLCSSISRTPSPHVFFNAWMQITLQEKAHPGFCSPVSVERNSPVFQTLPSNASTDRVSLLIFKAWTKKSLHSIPLTVLKVVEERHIPSTKSISLWRSSSGHREASIKRWQVCKANLWSVRRAERWWEDQRLWQHIWDFKIWTSHNRCNRV